MNIGIFSDCFLPTKNGVTTSICHLKRGLEKKGHKVVVVSVASPGELSADTSVYRCRSLPLLPEIELRLGLPTLKFVEGIIEREQLDILHTHTEFIVGWVARRAARKKGIPLVHTSHTLFEEYRHYVFLGRFIPRRFIRWLLRIYFAGCRAIVSPSKKSQNYIRSFVQNDPTMLIGNGVSAELFKPGLLNSRERDALRRRLGINVSDKVILFVGRIAEEKRIDELFESLLPLLEQDQGVTALFVGGGPNLKRMQERAGAGKLERKAIFPGYVEWERMPPIYGIADLFVTASLSEIHPMTVLEAIMCGLPVVARRDDSLSGVVESGVNGYLVDSDDEIRDKAMQIMSDAQLGLEFSANSLQIARRYTEDIHVNKCEALYKEVLNREGD